MGQMRDDDACRKPAARATWRTHRPWGADLTRQASGPHGRDQVPRPARRQPGWHGGQPPRGWTVPGDDRAQAPRGREDRGDDRAHAAVLDGSGEKFAPVTGGHRATASAFRDRRSRRRARRRQIRARRRTAFGRHPVVSAGCAVVVLLTPVWLSLGNALANPGLGTSVAARGAEWFRGHGGSSLVNWAENQWYSHHPPPVGGTPGQGVDSRRGASAAAEHPGEICCGPSSCPLADDVPRGT